MRTIYLAGPISGESYDQVMDRINLRRVPLQPFYDVIHPMTGKGELRTELNFRSIGYGTPVSTNRAIAGRDKWMVNQADIVFADLLGAERVSIGTMFEIAWAHLLGKLVVVCMEENNIHDHAFVLEATDLLFDNREDAIAFLIKLAQGDE